MPGKELLVEHRNLAADRHDLADQDFQGGARIGWQGIVGKRLLGQLREVGDAGVRDGSQLRQMRAQSIGEHGALAHKQGPGAMGHEDGLLLDRLDRHEPHRRALNGFADRFGIERVALAASGDQTAA